MKITDSDLQDLCDGSAVTVEELKALRDHYGPHYFLLRDAISFIQNTNLKLQDLITPPEGMQVVYHVEGGWILSSKPR